MFMYSCIFTYECVFYYVLGQRWPNKQVNSLLNKKVHVRTLKTLNECF